jgi:small subunit ribosomal protein S6
MNNYESVVILNSRISDEEKANFIEKIKTLVSENGQLTNVDDWGKKTLAYEISKEKEAYYLLFTFEAKPEFITEFERILRLDDAVLKHIVIKK